MAESERTTLDDMISAAIERAREDAIRRFREAIGEDLVRGPGSSELQRALVAEAQRLLREDPDVKERIKAAMLRVLDAPGRR